ncbi:MAG TPA: Grx4 family monothiol glutaredoxin [Gammaproteobacteria bacterium]|nr:Grx4 family monothiol glutaredoxin [Gammaproteobacteria bacterium]
MDVMDRIQAQVDSAAIVLYMKGTPQFPQCGFSSTASQTLASTGVEFAYVNIFDDQEVMQNLPAFQDWPTFPQIYFNSELIGGGDIIVEMAEMGTLQAAMQKAAEKFTSKVSA